MLHENLRLKRKERGLSQEELASRLHVVRQTISKWEKGMSVPDSELSGGFHADIQTVVFQKPICETVQVRIECAESLFLIVGLQAVCGRGDDGSNQECLVNIYTAAGWEYDFHNKTSSIIIARRMQGLNRQAINRC